MRYDAKAIGSGSEAAQSELQDKWHKVSMTKIRLHTDPHRFPSANDSTRGSAAHSKCAKAGNGRKARPAQCAVGSGTRLLVSY